MTAKEALEYFKRRKEQTELNDRVQQAEDLAIEALEKQIPKKPRATEAYPHRLYCPNCYYPFERNKSEIALIREHFIVGNKYCPECGARMDGETE